jgi:hypothetical protein
MECANAWGSNHSEDAARTGPDGMRRAADTGTPICLVVINMSFLHCMWPDQTPAIFLGRIAETGPK